jgi:hypothetical protein
MDDVFERFLSLAKRELSADDVRLLDPGVEPPEAANVVVVRLADGRHAVASFATAPSDLNVLTRRLAMLAGTFEDLLVSTGADRQKARSPIGSSLHEELKALAVRARAHDVVVIDGDSPVVWGCASIAARPRARNELLLRDVSDRELSSRDEPSAPGGLHAVPVADDSGPLQDATAPTGMLRMAPPPMQSIAVPTRNWHREEAPAGSSEAPAASSEAPAESSVAPAKASSGPPPASDDVEEPPITRHAIAIIRSLPSLGLLHKGKHLRHVSREGSYFLVLSFSGIYLLCMVFDGDFDELRAERAAHESLPRIERLVQALPPLDPDPQPMGDVIALRGARRR